jgi:hypothetical protein
MNERHFLQGSFSDLGEGSGVAMLRVPVMAWLLQVR